MKCDKRQYNVCLYGACLVISKKFFYEYDKVFYPETMFYAEEDILLTKCIMKNLVVLYEPSIRVTHSNKASTFINDKDKYERIIWRLKQLIESRKVYLELLKELGIK